MNWYSFHHHPPRICVVRCLDKNVTQIVLLVFLELGTLCVQFDNEVVCLTFRLHGFCMF